MQLLPAARFSFHHDEIETQQTEDYGVIPQEFAEGGHINGRI